MKLRLEMRSFNEAEMNAINLSRMSVALQGFAKLRPRFVHEPIMFGPAFAYAWLESMATLGIHRQGRQRCSRLGGLQPAQGIHEADALHGNLLTLSCLQHDQAHQVVDQREDIQFFRDAGHSLAT